MYKAYLEGQILLDSSSNVVLTEPCLELVENSAGSFSFGFYPEHALYDQLKPTSRIDFYKVRNGAEEWVWSGRPLSIETKFDLEKEVKCEGILAWLADSIQEPAEYHDMTVMGLLDVFLTKHNQQVEPSKRIKLGAVTVTDPNDSLYRYTNYETTLTAIQEKLIDRLGGHLRLRKEADGFYLDYLAEYPRTSTQPIELGQNLMDLFKENTFSEIGTILIPLGATVEHDEKDPDFPAALEQRVTIKSVNNGSDALINASGVEEFGKIVRVQAWDDVHVPAILKSKAEKYLDIIRYEGKTITATAVDLADAGIEIDDFRFLDRILVRSTPHDIDLSFPLVEMKIYPLAPESNQYTLGGAVKSYVKKSTQSLTEVKALVETKPSVSYVRKVAIDNATKILTTWAGTGYAIHTENESFYMDHPNKDDAQYVLRINLGGIGFSSTGIDGPYRSAWTIDGTFNTDFINAGTITADKLAVEYKNNVQQQITLAERNAKEDTAQKLKSYWTQLETQTQIKNTADQILLQAKEEAKAMVDDLATDAEGNVLTQLVNYYTKAEIDVQKDQIAQSVEHVEETMSDRFLGYYSKSEVQQLLDEWSVTVADKTRVQTPNLLMGTQYWDTPTLVAGATKTEDTSLDLTKLSISHTAQNSDRQIFCFRQDAIRFLSGNWYTLSLYVSGPSAGQIVLKLDTPKFEIVDAASHSGTVSHTDKTLTFTAKTSGRVVVLFKLGYRGLGIGQWRWNPFSFRYGVIPAGDVTTVLTGYIKAGSPAGTYTFYGVQLERGREATEYNAGTEDLTSRVAKFKVALDNINIGLETSYQKATTGINEAKQLAEDRSAQALAQAMEATNAKAAQTLADAKADTTNRLKSYYSKSEIDLKENNINLAVTNARTYASQEAGKALDAAKTDATFKANKALSDAKSDASTKADKALADAKKDTNEKTGKLWEDTQADATKKANDALDAAIADASNRLKSYYTKSEIDVKNSSINLSVTSAREYAESKASEALNSAKSDATTKANNALASAKTYTADQLKSYSTKAEIKVETDAIKSTVSKKVNEDSIISSINQSAETVAIAANRISLLGYTSLNGNFIVDTNGYAIARRFVCRMGMDLYSDQPEASRECYIDFHTTEYWKPGDYGTKDFDARISLVDGGSGASSRSFLCRINGFKSSSSHNTFNVWGNVTATNLAGASDRRLKREIEDINTEDAKNLLMKLQPKSFRFRDDASPVHHGLIYQDVKELVGEDSGLLGSFVGDEDGTIYGSLSYTELIADLIAVVQDQQKRIDSLEQILKKGD